MLSLSWQCKRVIVLKIFDLNRTVFLSSCFHAWESYLDPSRKNPTIRWKEMTDNQF